NVWDELDEYRLRRWKHAAGVMLKPALTFVDMGAYSDAVADFVKPRQTANNRVYACKGFEYLNRPGLVDESTGKKHKVRLFRIGTVTGKDRILSRLQAPRPEPGKVGANYMHFPLVQIVDEHGQKVKVPLPTEYFRQLTAETKIPVVDKRTRRTRFLYAMNHERNEILDLTVYAHAARVALQTIIDPKTYGDLKALHKKICEEREVPQTLVKLPGRRQVSAGVQL
ncbi:MAG TPA: terminase gpA endonuclease subunit, partial [Afipia sp.]